MHNLKHIAGYLVMFLLATMAAAPSLQAQSKDERAVRAVLDRLVRANSSVDPAVVRSHLSDISRIGGPHYSPFSEAAVSVTEMASQVEPWLETVASRSFAFTAPPKLSLVNRMGWTTAGWHAEIHFKDGNHQEIEGRSTLVFAKANNQWKIVHFHGSIPSTPPATGSALEAQSGTIFAQEQAIWEAYRNKQPEAIADYLADDFSAIEADQAYRVQGKQEYLRTAEARMSQTEINNYQLHDPKVEMLGDTALLTYYFSWSGTAGGRSVQQSGKASTIYVREGDAWKARHHHSSANPQPVPQRRNQFRDRDR